MEQTKASMGRKTVSFLTIVTIAGTMYTLYGVQSTFYVQFQELLGFSHTQLGILTSVAGWVTQFGFLISIFLTDRFSKRRMMTFAMALNGLAGFALSTFPPFGVMLVIFGVFAVCVDMLCWPNVLKAIRLLGDSGAQGRLFGGPIAGFCADKLTHSAVKFIRIALGVVAVTLTIFVLFPHESGKVSIYVAMLWILVVNSAIFCSRAIYFAPMDEIQVPREYTGSAMALGSMIGYLPGAFMKLIYGWILDAYAGLSGYRIVFIIMVVFAVLGMVSSTFVVKAINRQKEAGA